MADWTALSFSALTVLYALELNQIQANFTALVQGASGIPIWTKATITPGSAIVALSIDQDHNEKSLSIDSEATSTVVLSVTLANTSGTGILFANAGNQATGQMMYIHQDNPSSAANMLRLGNDGTGIALKVDQIGNGVALEITNGGTQSDLTAPNFTLKNGFIAPGGNEALQWDVVEFDMSGIGADSVAFTLDGTKCQGFTLVGYDVSTDDLFAHYDTGSTFFLDCSHNGTDLIISYSGHYVEHDYARIIVFTKA